MKERYTLVPEQSRFTVQAFAGGMLSGFAHNPVFAVHDFGCEVQFDPDAPDSAALQLDVKAESLELVDKVSDKDRNEILSAMRKDVLETSRYPRITFQSTSAAANKISEGWYRVRLQGTVSLHGANRPQEIDAQLRLSDGEMRLSGELKLLQSAFGIKRVSAVGGMIKVKDELKFSVDLVGRKTGEGTV